MSDDDSSLEGEYVTHIDDDELADDKKFLIDKQDPQNDPAVESDIKEECHDSIKPMHDSLLGEGVQAVEEDSMQKEEFHDSLKPLRDSLFLKGVEQVGMDLTAEKSKTTPSSSSIPPISEVEKAPDSKKETKKIPPSGKKGQLLKFGGKLKRKREQKVEQSLTAPPPNTPPQVSRIQRMMYYFRPLEEKEVEEEEEELQITVIDIPESEEAVDYEIKKEEEKVQIIVITSAENNTESDVINKEEETLQINDEDREPLRQMFEFFERHIIEEENEAKREEHTTKETCCSRFKHNFKCCCSTYSCSPQHLLPCVTRPGTKSIVKEESILKTTETLDSGFKMGWEQFLTLSMFTPSSSQHVTRPTSNQPPGELMSDETSPDPPTINRPTSNTSSKSLWKPICRDIIAGTEFFFSFLSLILSIASFSLGNNAAYAILHLVLAIIATILAAIDVFVSIEFFQACRNKIRERRNGGRQESDNGQNGTKRNKCLQFTKKTWDISRIIVAELVLYPLTICDMIDLLVGRSYIVNDAIGGLSYALFILSTALLIVYVYIVRLILLLTVAIRLNRRRRPQKNKERTEPDGDLDERAATTGFRFQIFFFFHVLGQMVVQILMLVAIGIKLVDDNANRFDSGPYFISAELWFMMVAGYIMPIIGILSFFIVTYYWVYEYPIGICINVLSLLECPGIKDILNPQEKIEEYDKTVVKLSKNLQDFSDKQEAEGRFQRLKRGINNKLKPQLRNDFKKLIATTLSNKLMFPFQHPGLVIISLSYFTIQFAFVVTTIVGINSAGGGVVFYYILSIVLGCIANMYVFAVAGLWIAVFIGILLLIGVVLTLFALYCFCVCLASDTSSNRYHRRTYY